MRKNTILDRMMKNIESSGSEQYDSKHNNENDEQDNELDND